MTDMISEEMVRVKAEQGLKDLAFDLHENAQEWGRGLPFADIIRIIKEAAADLSDEPEEE